MTLFLKGSDPMKLGVIVGYAKQGETKPGVVGISPKIGVSGEGDETGVLGWGATKDAVGIRGKGFNGGLAGFFDGPVGIDGELKVNRSIYTLGDVQLIGADLAEQFTVEGDSWPGAVMVLSGPDRVRLCAEAYDPRVAGVVSGAGSYRPGIVLDRRDGGTGRHPLGLNGKVWCCVDADADPISLGDMLTTSPRPGHAMRAADPGRAFGTVIGKALGSLRSGRGLVPVLVGLR